MDDNKIFSPIKDSWTCMAISLAVFTILWLPLIAFFALRIWDFFLLVPLFILFKTAATKLEMTRYCAISILIMVIPVYFMECYSIGEEIGREWLGNAPILPQTASGVMAWLLCIPWVGSWAPFFLMDYSRKKHSEKTIISFILAWGVFVGVIALNYGFCF